MKILRSGANAINYTPTDWVTVADISGEGTEVIQSDQLVLPFDNLPDFCDLKIDVRFTQDGRYNEGAVGHVRTYLEVNKALLNTPIAGVNGGGSSFYSHAMIATYSVPRRMLLAPSFIAGQGTTIAADRYVLRLHSLGNESGNRWLVGDIKARILYLPLTS